METIPGIGTTGLDCDTLGGVDSRCGVDCPFKGAIYIRITAWMWIGCNDIFVDVERETVGKFGAFFTQCPILVLRR